MASHKQLANWYAGLSRHLEAGVLLADALRLCEGLPAKDLEFMADRIEQGDPLESVLRNAPKWLPETDRYFISAGAETGNLPKTLQNLADRHEHIGATQLKVELGLLYPLAVFHVAAMLLPVVRMIDYESGFQWDTTRYLLRLLPLLLPVWAVLVSLYYLAKVDHPLLPRLLRCLPILNRYSRLQALADLSYSLGTFVAAGVPTPTAWRLSSRIVNDPTIAHAHKHIERAFKEGEEASEALKKFKCFPPEFRAFYKTGAESGKLDSNLLTAGRQYQESANRWMMLAALVYPSLIFALVAGFIIFTIFQVYGQYLSIFDQF